MRTWMIRLPQRAVTRIIGSSRAPRRSTWESKGARCIGEHQVCTVEPNEFSQLLDQRILRGLKNSSGLALEQFCALRSGEPKHRASNSAHRSITLEHTAGTLPIEPPRERAQPARKGPSRTACPACRSFGRRLNESQNVTVRVANVELNAIGHLAQR
jgi:hypothetical protein